MQRNGLVIGGLIGFVFGLGTAFVFGAMEEPASKEAVAPPPKARAAAPAKTRKAKVPRAGKKPGGVPMPRGEYVRPSVAQQGEDLLLSSTFFYLKVEKPSYLDIGSYHPVKSNNTYLLYRNGGRGVLVEPNPAFKEPTERYRPGDKFLNIGIGITDQKEADYYLTDGDGQTNTFSKEQVDEMSRKLGKNVLKKVIKMPLVNINKVIAENFKEGPPDLISVDVEGLDLAILETLDFAANRPKVIIVETLLFGTKQRNEKLISFLHSKGYVERGGTFVNTLFIDGEILK